MSLAADLIAGTIASDTVTVTATATKLSALLTTAGATLPAGQLYGLQINVPSSGAAVYYGGAGVTTSSLTVIPPGIMWSPPDAVRDPTALYLVTGTTQTVGVFRAMQ